MKNLSYYEKRGVLSLIVFSVVYASMYYDAYMYYRDDTPKQTLLNFWGNQFLELLLCLLFVYFISLFIFNVINKKLTGEERPKIQDERDKAIELRAIHASYYTLALGIFIALVAAIKVQTVSPIFMIAMVTFMLSAMVADIIRIVAYRKSS